MQVVTSVAQVRDAVRALRRPLGFVPTMGALHAGHLAVLGAAREAGGSVVASVFVNPLQFAPGEDFARYPRDLDGDREKLARAGAQLLFAPQAAELYPCGFSTAVDAGEIGERYEGRARPTHFRGVATVVTKLLQIVAPDTLYVGQKDAQQSAVLRRVVRDLDIPVEVRTVPTVREPDGLALSSRNAYLDAAGRAAAPTLYGALRAMLAALNGGASVADARRRGSAALSPLAQLEYLDLVDEATFQPLDRLSGPALIVGAARFGNTRLLDNLRVCA